MWDPLTASSSSTVVSSSSVETTLTLVPPALVYIDSPDFVLRFAVGWHDMDPKVSSYDDDDDDDVIPHVPINILLHTFELSIIPHLIQAKCLV